jgi:hypothetical protein
MGANHGKSPGWGMATATNGCHDCRESGIGDLRSAFSKAAVSNQVTNGRCVVSDFENVYLPWNASFKVTYQTAI